MPNWKGHYKQKVKSKTKVGKKPQRSVTEPINWGKKHGLPTVKKLQAATAEEKDELPYDKWQHLDNDEDGAEQIAFDRMYDDERHVEIMHRD